MRRLLVSLHLWLGLTVGALLVVVGVTGGILAFRGEIDRALNPELLVVEPAGERVPLDTLLATARAAYPDLSLGRFSLGHTPDRATELWMGTGPHERIVYFNPYSGAILGTRRPTDHFTGWLFDLHVHLLSGERGETVVGISGIILLLLSVTGVYVWWPGRGGLKPALTVRRDLGRRRFHFDLHRVGGVVSALLLIISAVTGAALVFYEPVGVVVNAVTNSPPRPAPPRSLVQAGVATVSVDSVLAVAERAIPNAVTSSVSFPSAPDGAFSVRRKQPAESHPYGRSFIYVDRYSGRVLRAEDALTTATGTRWLNTLYPTHIGRVAGMAGRVATAALGVAPLLLYVTGVVVWWSKRRRRTPRHAESRAETLRGRRARWRERKRRKGASKTAVSAGG